VELLCRLLDPVGQHRKEHIKPSKGKRSRKRKRQSAEKDAASVAVVAIPPAPEITSYLTLGFNTTVRYLENLSVASRPQTLTNTGIQASKETSETSRSPRMPLAAVFVCRTNLPPILTSVLPLLTETASLAYPQEQPIRLISLSEKAEARLAQALHQPKVGFIGLQSNAPGARGLIELVRDSIEPVDVPWLKEAGSAKYMPPKVLKKNVKIGQKKQKIVHSQAKDANSK